MRNRLIEKFRGKNGSCGFTMTEVLVVVAIVALVCTIVISSIAAISNNLKFKQKDEYAKTIFMAAQQNLSELRSDGSLAMLQTMSITENQKAEGKSGFPKDEIWSEEYYYVSAQNPELYSVVLPVNSVESVLRDESIIIEYNPYTGNVYAVFYCEDLSVEEMVDLYKQDKIERDNESWRKRKMIGYYCGTAAASPDLQEKKTKAQVEFTNGAEGIITVKIEMPTVMFTDVNPYDEFVSNLTVDLKITGEMTGTEQNQISLTIKELTSAANCSLDTDGKTVLVTYVLDSLISGGSFANKAYTAAAGTEAPAYLTQIQDQTGFKILPGENVTIQATATYSDATLEIESGVLTGVNPMFEYLEDDTKGGYILAVSNGRNLQNLNAIAPSIAKKVSSVIFTSGTEEAVTEHTISWNETVAYYNEKYDNIGSSTYVSEAPARALPYFVPISNENLFSAAAASEGAENGEPAAQTEVQAPAGAKVTGNGTRIVGLNIDATKYAGQAFYAVSAVDTYNTGLFAYANAAIDGLYIVNPIIKGYNADTAATGALVGKTGANSLITNCGVYIDKAPETGFDALLMTGPKAYGVADSWYGVSGQGAVGGLIGYADASTNVISKSLAAVPVSGTSGVGGFVGQASGAKFDSCYASGDVLASGSGTSNVGGFVGTTSGSDYSNCFATGDAEGTGNVGGFVGDKDTGTSFMYCYCVGVTTTKTATATVIKEKFSGETNSTPVAICRFLNLNRNKPEDKNNDYDYATVAEYGELTNLHTTEDEVKRYPASEWGAADADRTHAYEQNAGIYPFSMLNGMDYYGDWPTGPLDVGMAYYESYTSDADEYKFYFDNAKASQLEGKTSNKLVATDGYAILTKNSGQKVLVEIGSGNTKFSETLMADKIVTYTPEGNADTYAVYFLPKAALDAAESGTFYTEVKVTYTPSAEGDETEYTFYFNPNAAYTHINPSTGTTAANPDKAVPSQIAIRTARQLANMSGLAKHNYVQELNIDANEYTASSYGEATSKEVIAIENTIKQNSPEIKGTYNGSNKTIKLHNGKTTALFSTISGTVKNLNVEANGVTIGNGSSGSTGIVTNSVNGTGTVEKVNLQLKESISVTATSSAGLFAGVINGTVKNCNVTAENAVQFHTGNANASVNEGGFAGSIGGTVSDVTINLNAVGGYSVGGFVGSVTSNGSINNTIVTLNGNIVSTSNTPSDASAAGFAIMIAGKVNSSTVVLNRKTENETIGNAVTGGGKAAGFVCTVRGNVSDCAVVGSGQIAATAGKAAGFAGTVNGTVSGSRVTPATAENKDAYKVTNNSKLTVSGTGDAAGFALEVGKSGKITNCNALGTVTGSNASGFVNANQGAISGCIANVALSGGSKEYAFAAGNAGTVTNSYGWYSTSAEKIELPSGNKYKSCYFADLTGTQKSILFDGSGNMEEILNVDLASANTVSRLNAGGSRWAAAGSKGAYPYDSKLSSENQKYLYPMLREHPGNWTNTSASTTYGIVYYEKYKEIQANDSNYTYHTVYLNDSSDANTSKVTFTEDNTIVEAGYALFCVKGTNPFGERYLGAPLDNSFASYFRNKMDNDKIEVYKLKVKGEMEINGVSIVSFYADAINVTNNTYQIRTADQLANIGEISGASFSQTHDIVVDEEFVPAASFNGTYDGNNRTISGTVAPTGNFGFLAVKAGDKAVIKNVNVSGTINVTAKNDASYTIGGLVGTSSGEITNCNVDVDINYTQADTDNADKADNATIGGLVGKVNKGSIKNCEVSGSINLLSGKTDDKGNVIAPVGQGRTYVVGGVIGNDNGDSQGVKVEYTDITSSVAVDAAWADSADTQCPGNKGSVGMFVGKVTNGKFTNCSSTADNSTFWFLGRIKTNSETLPDNGNTWFSKDNSTNLIVDKGGLELNAAAEANKFAIRAAGYSYNTYDAELNSCTFKLGEKVKTMLLNSNEYFFQADELVQDEKEKWSFVYQQISGMACSTY